MQKSLYDHMQQKHRNIAWNEEPGGYEGYLKKEYNFDTLIRYHYEGHYYYNNGKFIFTPHDHAWLHK